MSVLVAFHGGPADGMVTEYPKLDTALPSLFWSRDEPDHTTAIYRRSADAPDPATGAWSYSVATT